MDVLKQARNLFPALSRNENTVLHGKDDLAKRSGKKLKKKLGYEKDKMLVKLLLKA